MAYQLVGWGPTSGTGTAPGGDDYSNIFVNDSVAPVVDGVYERVLTCGRSRDYSETLRGGVTLWEADVDKQYMIADSDLGFTNFTASGYSSDADVVVGAAACVQTNVSSATERQSQDIDVKIWSASGTTLSLDVDTTINFASIYNAALSPATPLTAHGSPYSTPTRRRVKCCFDTSGDLWVVVAVDEGTIQPALGRYSTVIAMLVSATTGSVLESGVVSMQALSSPTHTWDTAKTYNTLIGKPASVSDSEVLIPAMCYLSSSPSFEWKGTLKVDSGGTDSDEWYLGSYRASDAGRYVHEFHPQSVRSGQVAIFKILENGLDPMYDGFNSQTMSGVSGDDSASFWVPDDNDSYCLDEATIGSTSDEYVYMSYLVGVPEDEVELYILTNFFGTTTWDGTGYEDLMDFAQDYGGPPPWSYVTGYSFRFWTGEDTHSNDSPYKTVFLPNSGGRAPHAGRPSFFSNQGSYLAMVDVSDTQFMTNTFTMPPNFEAHAASEGPGLIVISYDAVLEIPWLRQTQRDDVVRVNVGSVRNRPRSIQGSIRQNWKNTYL